MWCFTISMVVYFCQTYLGKWKYWYINTS
jgi:hypothetical protein